MEEFLSLILPDKGYYVSFIINGKRRYNRVHDSIPKLAAALQEAEQLNYHAYHACSAYVDEFIEAIDPRGKAVHRTRVQKNVRAVRAVWCDLDVGENKDYSCQQEAMSALVDFVKTFKLPKPNIVSSGYGLHVYWAFNEELLPAVWKTYATKFKQVAEAADFKQDKSRASDEASVLRTPGTTNRKIPESPRPVTWLVRAPRIPVDDFMDRIDAAAKHFRIAGIQQHHVDPVAEALTGGLSHESPPADPDIIANKCQQLNACRASEGDIPEPLWYLMLGTLAFCERAEDTALLWSKGHPNFDPQQTLEKLQQWRAAASGPTLCSKWDSENGSGCRNCSYKGKISTPNQLGVIYQPASLPAEAIEANIPDAPYPFRRSQDGLVLAIEDEIPRKFFDYDVYVEDMVQTHTGALEARIKINKPHVGWTAFHMPYEAFVRDDKFWQAFIEGGAMIANKKDAVLMAQYCRSYVAQLEKLKSAVKTSKNFGWKADGSFVLGAFVVERSGNVRHNPTLESSIPATRDIRMTGSLQEWINLTRVFDAPDMDIHAFALLCGLAAPLFKFTGHGGAIVNLLGKTGVGKSSIQRMINSIWGHPQMLMLSAKDTDNSKMARLGYMNNLPVCVDEMGNISGENLSSLILKITQGMDVRRLKQDGTEREPREWSTIVVTSSNHGFTDKLMGFKIDSEAEIMRLMEITISQSHYFSNKENAKRFNKTLDKNYGKAGALFIRHLVQHQDTIEHLLEEAAHSDIVGMTKFTTRERFWEAVITCCLVAGKLATQMGLISFDYENAIYRAAMQIENRRDFLAADDSSWVETLGRFVSTNINHLLSIKFIGRGNPVIVREPRMDGLHIRIEQHFDQSRLMRAEMSIDYFTLQHYLAQSFGNIREFIATLNSTGALISADTRKSLGRGSDFLVPPTRTLVINMLHADLNSVFSPLEVQPAQLVNIDNHRDAKK